MSNTVCETNWVDLQSTKTSEYCRQKYTIVMD